MESRHQPGISKCRQGSARECERVVCRLRLEAIAAALHAPHRPHQHRLSLLRFIFGGYDGLVWRGDVVALNLEKHEWEQVVSCDGPGAPAPGPRASGTFTVLEDDKIVLFGGYNGEEFLNDLWVLHITASADEDALPTYRWESVPTTHEARASLGTATAPVARAGVPSCEWPSPRSGHVGVAIGSLLVMVAGRHRAGRNNDVFLLDAASGWSWYAPTMIGEAFKPRKTHAVGLVGARLFLFGGHSGTDWCSDLHVLDM